jgi:rhodanese-related sulfurtransferase
MTIPDQVEASPQEAYAAVQDGAVLIDVREEWEYQEMSIPGAVLIPLGQVLDRLDEIPEDSDVYVHCRMGSRSARAVEFLRAHGRPRSFNVAGGIEAWEEAGLPITSP